MSKFNQDAFDKYCCVQRNMPEGTQISLMAKAIEVAVDAVPEDDDSESCYGMTISDVLEQYTKTLWLPDKIMLIGFILPDKTEQHHFVNFQDYKE